MPRLHCPRENFIISPALPQPALDLLPGQGSRGHRTSKSWPGGANFERDACVIQEPACVLTLFSNKSNQNPFLLGKKIYLVFCLKVFSNLENCFSL